MHLPKVAEKVRPPRMMHTKFPLGRTFSSAFDLDLQSQIVKDLLDFAQNGAPEQLLTMDKE